MSELDSPIERLHQLEKFVAQVKYISNSDSDATKQDHRDIYNYIEQAILSPKATMMTAVPSLKITIYAIRNIMYPKLAKGQIPDLLDLLATVEFYRARTLDKSQDALVWNDYYNGKGKGEEARTLTVMETGELLSLGDKKHLWRQVYVDIVGQLCKIDMYFLWTAKTPSMTDYFVRFNEYFPFLTATRAESPRLFYKNFSEEEHLNLSEIGLSCCDFAQDTVEWALDWQHDRLQPINEIFQTSEFRAVFKVSHDLEVLSKGIEGYLEWTEASAATVTRVFEDA